MIFCLAWLRHGVLHIAQGHVLYATCRGWMFTVLFASLGSTFGYLHFGKLLGALSIIHLASCAFIVGKHQEEHPGLLRVPRVSLEYTKDIYSKYTKNKSNIYPHPHISKIYPRYHIQDIHDKCKQTKRRPARPKPGPGLGPRKGRRGNARPRAWAGLGPSRAGGRLIFYIYLGYILDIFLVCFWHPCHIHNVKCIPWGHFFGISALSCSFKSTSYPIECIS